MKQIYFSVLLLICALNLQAIDFNDKQKAIVYNEAIKVLQNYESLSNQMADAVVDMDQTNRVSQKMIDLFVNRKAMVFNDLDPNFMLSEMYELETYVNNLMLWYPDGMKISIDFEQLKAGNIIAHGNNVFTVDLMVNKVNNGNYLNRQMNELEQNIVYRIAFFQEGTSFNNFKIAGARSSKSTNNVTNDKLLASVKSVAFSEKDKELIQQQTVDLFNDYVNFINLLTDPNEYDEDKVYYKISFLELFKDSTINVANDIEPEPQERWIPVVKYPDNIRNAYPEGISNLGLNIDSVEYGDVIAEENNCFYINAYVNKFFSGKYQGKNVHRVSDKFDFKVSFEKDENTYKNFKLASIDKFGISLYEEDAEQTTQLPQLSVSVLERKGLYFGAAFAGGISDYKNPNLTTDPILDWNIENKMAVSVDAYATLYFASQIGVSGGIGYNQYNTLLQLNGTYQSAEYFTDVNEQTYLKNIDAAYDSSLTFNYFSVPIKAIFHSNKSPEKWGVYGEIGLVSSFLLKANYTTTGSFSTSGYYAQFPEGFQTDNSEAWGFETRNPINESGNADVKTMHFALSTALGVTYPLNYFTNLFFAGEAFWGLNNINTNTIYTDAFGNQSEMQKVSLSKYVLKLGMTYKF